MADSHAEREVGELSNVELLDIVLGGGAGMVCDAGASLREAADELGRLSLPARHRRKLRLLFEFAKRYGETPWRAGEAFQGSGAVYAHFRERLASEVVEHFYAVLLDNKHRRIKDVLVSKGSLTASIVHPRDIYRPVIEHSAAAVIFVHNHPSGDPTPSKEDISITQRLREVGDLMGVRVLDHIIIGKGRYVSLVDDGYW